jgi:transposase
VEAKERRERRAFTPAYKAEVVELCRSGSAGIGKVARDLDLSETVVRRWLAQADVDGGRRQGLTTSERAELGQLRKEVRVLKAERDLLKRAMAFLAKEIR